MGFGSWRFKSSHPHSQTKPLRGHLRDRTSRVPKEHNISDGASIGTTATLHIAISKTLSVPARGFREAVADARRASAQNDVDGLFIAATNASQWVTAITWQKAELKNNKDVVALSFARDRAHHQLGSLISQDANGTWTWRSLEVLPLPEPRFQGRTHEQQAYRTRLADQPLLDVFDRLEPVIAALA